MESIGAKRSFKVDELIMEQGDEGKCAYVIEDGRVEIFVTRDDGTQTSVGTRGVGAIIGEMALVDSAPRTASVKALEPCTMYEISKADFSNRLNQADPILKMITKVILARYRETLVQTDIMSTRQRLPAAEFLERSYVHASDALETIKMTNEFKEALETNDTTLVYQPIINLQDGSIRGYEALMRWEHPELGFISPVTFIPIAEASGLIVTASQWALKESCEALSRIEQHAGKDYPLFMGVNFSSRDFASDNFVQSIYDTISLTDLAPEQIHIEITERMLMDQPDNAREVLEMCRDGGMSIAIDDFGTGYSSLSYLHHFPIDTLKIDYSFVNIMHEDERVMSLVKSIVHLCHNLNMKIVAEGIETHQQAQTLRELGCDYGQGFYFSRPLTEEDARQFTRDTQKIEF